MIHDLAYLVLGAATLFCFYGIGPHFTDNGAVRDRFALALFVLIAASVLTISIPASFAEVRIGRLGIQHLSRDLEAYAAGLAIGLMLILMIAFVRSRMRRPQ